MAKQLNVNLAFTADTGKAKAQLQDLQKQLDQLTKGATSGDFGSKLNSDMQKALTTVSQLKAALNSSTTPQGLFDLSHFNTAMKQSGMSIEKYKNALLDLGPSGASAFHALGDSIIKAETPIKRVNAKMEQFKTTLMNTARWQLSSSMLHGFMGALSSAYNYAQDLNESLNNIRIVTGYNIDQMSQFAEKANEAARALSTTTTKYTDASLIYYQQGGMTDKEIAERTEITVKMANAAGVSAQIASDQLTAVWNNFYDGSKSLEYYADVMTKLGAETASSTDEISEGLEKFAAVADTVGLSYEYATAALATVTAETRQSADVVGTAFKTLFARLQDLELGETLEDGTDLGKYSAALKKVGVDIKDANGELKDMDIIIDELGAKWGDLNKDTQIALAQTVAGTRQYTQLVALMDNYDKFQGNLDLAYTSEGTLQEQADIYAESWQAASDRVRAALEGIYQTLIDDEAIISILNGLEDMITYVDRVIDAMGGLEGVIFTVLSMFSGSLMKGAITNMTNLANNIYMSTKKGQEKYSEIRNEYLTASENLADNSTYQEDKVSNQVLLERNKIQMQIVDNASKLRQHEVEGFQAQLDTIDILSQQAISQAKLVDELEQEVSLRKQSLEFLKSANLTGSFAGNKNRDVVNTAHEVATTQNHQTDNKAKSLYGDLSSVDLAAASNANSAINVERIEAAKKALYEFITAKDEATKTQKWQAMSTAIQNASTDIKHLQTLSREGLLPQTVTSGDYIKTLNELEVLGKQSIGINNLLKKLKELNETTSKTKMSAGIVDLEQELQNLENAGYPVKHLRDQIEALKNKIQETDAVDDNIFKDPTENAEALQASLTQTIQAVKTAKTEISTKANEKMDLGEQQAMALNTANPTRKIDFNKDTTTLFAYSQAQINNANTTNLVTTATEKLKKQINETKHKTADFTTSMTALARAGTSVLSTINAVQSVVETFGDDSLSTGQKITSALGAIGMQIPMLISGINALWTAMGPIGLAIIGITTGVVALISAIEKAHVSAEEALDMATEKAEEQQKKIDELTENYDNLTTSVDNLGDKYKELDNLRQGTDEWRQAVSSLNNEVLALVQEFPELASLMENRNGVLYIDVEDQDYKDFLQGLQENIQDETIKGYYTTIDQYEAEKYNLFTEAAKKFSNITADELEAIYKDFSIDEIRGAVTKNEQGEYINEDVRKKLLSDDYGFSPKDLSGLEIDFSPMSELNSSILTLDASINALTAAINEDRLSQVGSETYNKSEYKDEVSRQVTALAEENGWYDKDATLDRLANAEAQSRHGENASPEDVANIRDDLLTRWDNFTDENGALDISQFLANAAIDQSTWDKSLAYDTSYITPQMLTEYTKAVEQRAAEDDALYGRGAHEAIKNQDYENINIQSLFDLLNNVRGNPEEYKDYAIGLGYADTLDSEGNILKTAVENFIDDIVSGTGTAMENIAQTTGEIVENTNFGNNNALKTSMIKQLQDWKNTISEIDFNQLSGIDLNAEDAEAQVQAWGENVGLAQSEIDNLLSIVAEIPKVFNNTNNAIQEKIASINSITQGLEEGDSISDKDYTLLEEMGVNVDYFFRTAADGSHELAVSAEELAAAMKDIKYDEIAQNNFKYAKAAGMASEGAIDNGRFMGNALAGEFSGAGSVDAAARLLSQFNMDDYGISQEVQNAVLEYVEGGYQNLSELTSTLGEEIVNAAGEIGDAYMESMEMMGSLADSTADLDSMLASGQINQDVYDKYYDSAKESSIQQDADLYGLDADQIRETAEAFQEMSEAGVEGYEGLANNAESAKEAATRYLRLQEAVQDLADNYEEYDDVLSDVQKATTKTEKAMIANGDSGKKLQKSIAGLLGTTEDLIDADLLDAIDPDDFAAAAKGDEAAIGRIRDSFIKLQAEANGIDFNSLKNEIDNLPTGVDIDLDDQEFLNQLIAAKLAAGATAADIESMLSGMNIDANVEPFYGSMQEMADASAEAGTAVIANTSFQAEATPTTIEATDTVEETAFEETVTATPITRLNQVAEEGATEPASFTTTVWQYRKNVNPVKVPSEESTEATATSINMTNAAGESGGVGGVKINNVRKSAGGSNSVAPSSRGGGSSGGGGGGGGGGGSSTPAEKKPKTHKSDVVERYKEINDALQDVTHELTMQEKITDDLYGSAKIAAMKKEAALLKEQALLLKQKADAAKDYAVEDKADLDAAIADANTNLVGLGINGADINIGSAQYDSDGDWINYTPMMETLHGALNYHEDIYNNLSTKEEQDEYYKTYIEPIEKEIEAVNTAKDRYDQSKEDAQSFAEEWQETIDAWQTMNYEAISEKLTIHLELNEDDLSTLEYFINKMEGDFYKSAEVAGKMAEQGVLYMDNAKAAAENLGFSPDDFEDGFDIEKVAKNANPDSLIGQYGTYDSEMGAYNIDDAQFIEGLRTSKEELISNLEALNELDKAMMEYYGNTLDAAMEELSFYTDQMEHQNDVMDHYMNIVSLLGGENDLELMNTMLEGQAQMAANTAKVSKANYDMLKGEQADIKAQMDQALADGDEAAYELFKQQWEDITAEVNNAESQMLEDTEAWLESMKAVMTNKMEQAAEGLEKALTKDGLGFDYMNEQMESLNVRQEEFLTKTNQVYETNKMMRELNTKIDETSNKAAKQRLKNFQKEIEAAQEQNELSHYELEILQAKMDLELAQIALEEAQNAKSQVRLTRDSEGNFSYTYTADQDKVAEAEQAFEDAQNNLYNISLEGANKYTEMYVQAQQDMYNELKELSELYYVNGEISEEEFNARKAVIMEKYMGEDGILTTYSRLYNVAIETDDRAREESWNNSFASMTQGTKTYKENVDLYLGECQKAHDTYKAAAETALGEQGLGSIYEAATGNIDAMKEALNGEDGLVTANNELVKTITDPENGIIAGLKEELTGVRDVTTAYADQRDTILADIGALEDYLEIIDKVIQKTEDSGGQDSWTDPTPTEPEEKKQEEEAPKEPEPEEEKPKVPELVVGNKVRVKKTAKQFSNGAYMQSWVPGYEFEVFEIDGDHVLIGDRNLRGTYTGWVPKSALEGFDTGGYTGKWGAEGRLAILHEKELVLNKDQTSDFLESLKVQETLTKKTQMLLDEFNALSNGPASANEFQFAVQQMEMKKMLMELEIQAEQMMQSSIGMMDRIQNYDALQSQMTSEMSGQQITIYADFPDASDYQEIQMAFDNLINRASQYANRSEIIGKIKKRT